MKKYLFILFIILVMGCDGKSEKHIIAKIPEASGICYSSNSDTLFVANDEGKIYEITKEGKIKREKFLGKYDLEGVTCLKNRLYFVEEKKSLILIVDKESLKLEKKIKIKSKKLKNQNNSGLEAITIINGKIYVANQGKTDGKYPIFIINSLNSSKVKIDDKIEHKYKDIAGLTFFKNRLFMLSDKKNLLIIYNLDKQKVIKEIKLKKFAGEGVTFDNKGFIYFADDNGAVLKFATKELGL